MIPPTQLESPRLLLRKSSVVDAEDIFRNYAADENVTHFLPWEPHVDIQVTRRFLQQCNENWQRGTDFAYVIIHPERNEVIGMISMRPKGHNVEFGFVLARPYWGQGLTAEGLSTLCDWCLSQPEIWRVEAYCDIDNKASARVMVKAGMEREGLLRKYLAHINMGTVPRDSYLYSRVRDAL